MPDNDEDNEKRHKKVTAATTDAPQEEFISPVNLPSKTENPSAEETDRPVHKDEPPQP